MPQSILVDNLQNRRNYFEDKIIKFAEKFQMDRRFQIGEPMRDSEMLHTLAFSELICTTNCDVIDLIDKKLRGEEIPCKKQPLHKLINSCITEEKTCNDVVSDCVGEIEW